MTHLLALSIDVCQRLGISPLRTKYLAELFSCRSRPNICPGLSFFVFDFLELYLSRFVLIASGTEILWRVCFKLKLFLATSNFHQHRSTHFPPPRAHDHRGGFGENMFFSCLELEEIGSLFSFLETMYSVVTPLAGGSAGCSRSMTWVTIIGKVLLLPTWYYYLSGVSEHTSDASEGRRYVQFLL